MAVNRVRVMLQRVVDSTMMMIGIGVKIFALNRDGRWVGGDAWETVRGAYFGAGGMKI